MPKLSEVFGITSSVPTYTYVDRAKLDERFRYLLSADRHIVIYGASKQGKTSLRRKILSDDKVVVVRCRPEMKLEGLYSALLGGIGVAFPRERSISNTIGAKGTVGGEGEGGIPLFAKAKAKAEIEIGGEEGAETKSEMPDFGENLEWIARQIEASGRRVVVEDFHYLNEDERKRLAFDLKAFWDLGVFLIIVGIWAEQNLLVYYNADLSGRVEEVDLVWSNDDLLKVLKFGEDALGIVVEEKIKALTLRDAEQNVGLLQRLAEQLCLLSGVYETRHDNFVITDEDYLRQAREKICAEERQRYRLFADNFIRGFKGYEGSELKVYEHIARVCIEASDDELRNGIPRDLILERVQRADSRVRLSDLSAALNKIDRLQSDRKISPLVFTYNDRRVSLVDRELLFFRRYGNPTWPWAEKETATT